MYIQGGYMIRAIMAFNNKSVTPVYMCYIDGELFVNFNVVEIWFDWNKPIKYDIIIQHLEN